MGFESPGVGRMSLEWKDEASPGKSVAGAPGAARVRILLSVVKSVSPCTRSHVLISQLGAGEPVSCQGSQNLGCWGERRGIVRFLI